ncbi:hypothetical protein [Nitrosospira multiformis]|jgi:hypothetical protein|uniref:Pentapeptide MXKDX repeat protein n=1 Tax=Nitrosospira multiformis TaxID=1231 RepID=A0A1I7FWJ9_9PROT|nr:hypothetical protein [Nitrosospira multiformis]SFU40521.1 hypothetical protein SAMN05216417_102281 [Nitrosospira multiformis]
MNKLTSIVVLASFTAVCSFSALAGSHDSDKGGMDKSYQDMGKKDKKDVDKNAPSSTYEVTREKMPKDLSEGVKQEYRDQEVMNKKPYKQPHQ